MSTHNNSEKYSYWATIASALISIIALISSIKSCSTANEALAEVSKPEIVLKVEDDRIIISNEGKGTASIIKVLYAKKNKNPECFNKIESINEIGENYETYHFYEGESLKSGGFEDLLKCTESCDDEYHKNYIFYVIYKDYKNKKYQKSTTKITDEDDFYKKADGIPCNQENSKSQ